MGTNRLPINSCAVGKVQGVHKNQMTAQVLSKKDVQQTRSTLHAVTTTSEVNPSHNSGAGPVDQQASQNSSSKSTEHGTQNRCDLCAARLLDSSCVTTSCAHVYHQTCLESYVKQLIHRGVTNLRCPACMVPLNVVLSSQDKCFELIRNHQNLSCNQAQEKALKQIIALPSTASMNATSPMNYKTVSPKQVSLCSPFRC
jgi:hypothetical protein